LLCLPLPRQTLQQSKTDAWNFSSSFFHFRLSWLSLYFPSAHFFSLNQARRDRNAFSVDIYIERSFLLFFLTQWTGSPVFRRRSLFSFSAAMLVLTKKPSLPFSLTIFRHLAVFGHIFFLSRWEGT